MASQVQSLTASVACTRCGAALLLQDAIRDYGALCSACGAVTWMSVFPAAFQPPKIEFAEPVVDPDEASCFYHQGKRAIAPCDICGRFLCALCRIELQERNVCPACLETARRNHSIQSLEPRRVLYDNIALGVATIPALFIWPVIFSAPAGFFVALRYWRKPGSIVRRSRIRFWLAILLALLEIAAMITLVVILVRNRLRF